MRPIPYINIADTNCWIVYIMPLSQENRNDYNIVKKVQDRCIRDCFFGMGWAVDISGFDGNTAMTDENVELYINKYEECGWTVSEQACNDYKRIKKGDYVIARNKDGHFYVGRVSSDGANYLYNKDDEVLKLFSWGCKVEKWVDYTMEKEVPSEIVGRFSQRFHSTIQRIARYRQRLLVIKMFEDRNESDKKFVIPQLAITKNNFVRSLNYKELEDLVAVFISDKHRSEGYSLLPSSCKVSQQNVEFYFVANNREPITCQVKNQEDITIERYIEDNNRNGSAFSMIYLFSGKWSDSDVMLLRKKYKEYPYIYIITPNELYTTMVENQIFSNPFYDYRDPGRDIEDICSGLVRMGYIEKTEPDGKKEFSKDENFICFVKRNGLFYSKEFGALVLSWHILEDKDKEDNNIENLRKDLNGLS